MSLISIFIVFAVYDYDEDSSFTNIQALVTETHLYGSLAPERLLQILQLVQGQMNVVFKPRTIQNNSDVGD